MVIFNKYSNYKGNKRLTCISTTNVASATNTYVCQTQKLNCVPLYLFSQYIYVAVITKNCQTLILRSLVKRNSETFKILNLKIHTKLKYIVFYRVCTFAEILQVSSKICTF